MPRYSAGDWQALVAGQSMALFPGRVPPPVAERIWLDLRQGKGLGAILDGLGGAFGTSLSNLPEFGIVSISDNGEAVNITVRGMIEARAQIVESADQVVVSGAGVTTWSERTIRSVVSIELVTPGSQPASMLPILDGIVMASRVLLPVRDRVPLPIAAPPPEVSARQRDSMVSARAASAERVQDLGGSVAGVQAMLSHTVLASVEAAAVRHTDNVMNDEDPGIKSPHTASRPDQEADEPKGSGGQGLHADETPRHDPPIARSTGGDHDNRTRTADEVLALQTKAGLGDWPSSRAASTIQAALLITDGIPPVLLDRNVIIGRKPRLSRVQGGHVPRLVTVPSPGGEVSGSHLELRVEDTDVLAVDLNSTNGTRLLRPGQEPMRLRPGEEVLLLTGDRLDLGEDVVLKFEGLV